MVKLKSMIVEQVTEAVSANIIEQLTPYTDAVKEFSRDDDTRLREKMEATPRVSSLTDMLNESIAGLDKSTGISKSEAAKLGSPKEAKAENPFVDALIKGEGDQYLQKIMANTVPQT